MTRFTSESTIGSAASTRQIPAWVTRGWTVIWKAVRPPGLHRDASLLMAGTILVSIGGYLSWKLVTLLYPPAVVGIAAVTLSSATFLSGLANLGLTTGLVRFMPNLESSSKAALVTFAHLVSVGISVVASLAFLAGRRWWATDLVSEQSASLAGTVFVLLVLALAQINVHTGVLQAERRMGMVLAKNLGVTAVQLALILLLPRSLGPLGIVSATLIPSALAAVLLFWAIRRFVGTPALTLHFRKTQIGPMTRYSLGNLIFNQLWALPGFVFPLLALHLIGPTANAHLAIAWLINGLLLTIPNSVAVALLIDSSYAIPSPRDVGPAPIPMDTEGREGIRARTALWTNLALLAPLALAIAALASPILGLFGPDYAQEAAGLLRLLVLAGVPGSITSVYLAIKRVRKQVWALNVLASAVSGLAVVSSAVLVRYLGLTGLGWGWFASQTAFAVALIKPLWREQGMCRGAADGAIGAAWPVDRCQEL